MSLAGAEFKPCCIVDISSAENNCFFTTGGGLKRFFLGPKVTKDSSSFLLIVLKASMCNVVGELTNASMFTTRFLRLPEQS